MKGGGRRGDRDKPDGRPLFPAASVLHHLTRVCRCVAFKSPSPVSFPLTRLNSCVRQHQQARAIRRGCAGPPNRAVLRWSSVVPMNKPSGNVTELLSQVGAVDNDKLAKQLMPLVYEELHSLADRFLKTERKGHTLQPTALVHEAYLRLVDQSRVNWQGKTHFFAIGAAMMRRVLIDHARTKGRAKRGGDWHRLQLQDDLLGHSAGQVDLMDLSNALEELAALDPQQASMVELRFFGGLTVDEVAEMLGVSKRKVEGEWTHAKAWLKNRLSGTARQ